MENAFLKYQTLFSLEKREDDNQFDDNMWRNILQFIEVKFGIYFNLRIPEDRESLLSEILDELEEILDLELSEYSSRVIIRKCAEITCCQEFRGNWKYLPAEHLEDHLIQALRDLGVQKVVIKSTGRTVTL
jgi:hypothetical protein